MDKKIGYIGLGKMGFNMCELLLEKGWEVHAYNRTYDTTQKLEKLGGIGYRELTDMVVSLASPRVVWLMVPYTVVDQVIEELQAVLKKGDYIIDGGNSPFKDSIRRSQLLAGQGINFLDVGVSGGPNGARHGACIMVGGMRNNYDYCTDLFNDISVPEGHAYMGKSGAGHFVKMVHNGIEYGMMQAIAEGFSIMHASDFGLDVTEVARVYGKSSVIESRLLEWLYQAYKAHGTDLEGITNKAVGTGEGQWTIQAAKELGVSTAVINDALHARQLSQENPNYQAQIIMALRNQFGGHDIK